MQKLAIKYGAMMFGGFTLFFLLMHLFGLSDNYLIRIFNIFIHIPFLYLAIREYRKNHRDTFQNYAKGLALGMYTSAIGVLGFAIFFMLFLVASPEFMMTLQEKLALGQYLNPITTSLFIIVEGTAVSLIASYILSRIVGLQLSNGKA